MMGTAKIRPKIGSTVAAALVLSWAMALMVACAPAGMTAAPEKERVILAVGGKAGVVYLPLTVVERLGLFEQEGLKVEIQDFAGGARSLQALVGGSADVVMGYYDHTIQMQAQGRDITAVVQVGRYPGLVLAVRSDLADRVRSPADLKGMRVGVTAPGSSTHFFLNYLLVRSGLTPNDVAAVGIGATSTAIAAVERKEVDALVNFDPAITQMESRGLIQILVDTRAAEWTQSVFGGEYPAAVLYTLRSFVDRYPETTQRLVNAIVKGLQWMQGKTPEQVAAVLPEEYFLGNRELYLRVLARSLEMFSPTGRFSEGAPDRVHKVLSMFDQKVAQSNVELSRTFTNRFVDRVRR